MFEAKPSDLSIMPFGMCDSQLSMGRPKIRNGTPLRRRCAATDSPYGPAPMIAVLSMSEEMLLYDLSSLKAELTDRQGGGDSEGVDVILAQSIECFRGLKL